MKKLRLEIEQLAVESFEASEPAAGAGTVHGRGETAGCDSIRLCLPDDPSYDPCTETGVPCWDTGDAICTRATGCC
jgi:hypothetical protein